MPSRSTRLPASRRPGQGSGKRMYASVNARPRTCSRRKMDASCFTTATLVKFIWSNLSSADAMLALRGRITWELCKAQRPGAWGR